MVHRLLRLRQQVRRRIRDRHSRQRRILPEIRQDLQLLVDEWAELPHLPGTGRIFAEAPLHPVKVRKNAVPGCFVWLEQFLLSPQKEAMNGCPSVL
ncbi:MAG TPA: hypothetical protein VM120_15320 [Bryobacteraceae bacterium]|nr:hypothetical protein [Bryobacteraceae bacterium]